MPCLIALAIMMALAPGLSARASAVTEMALAPENVVKLESGPNTFDLDGDGTSDLDVLLRVRNGARRSFTGYEFYVRGLRRRSFRIAKDRGFDALREGRCQLSAVVMLVDGPDREKRVTVIHALRALGAVRFAFYRLTGQGGSESDQPAYRLELLDTVTAKRLYCDVREALDEELGLAVDKGGESALRERGAAGETVVRIENGLNRIDLDRDGIKDLVVASSVRHGRHGSRTKYSFLARVEFRPGVWEWHLVLTHPSLETRSEGACRLSDIRLLLDHRVPAKPATLVHVERAFGQVNFSFYAFADQEDRLSDFPVYGFKLIDTVRAKRLYCDVGDALREELGID